MSTDFCFMGIPVGFKPDYDVNEAGCLVPDYAGYGSFSYTPIRRWVHDAVEGFRDTTGISLWYDIGDTDLIEFRDYIMGLPYNSEHRRKNMTILEHRAYVREFIRIIRDMADVGARIDWIE